MRREKERDELPLTMYLHNTVGQACRMDLLKNWISLRPIRGEPNSPTIQATRPHFFIRSSKLLLPNHSHTATMHVPRTQVNSNKENESETYTRRFTWSRRIVITCSTYYIYFVHFSIFRFHREWLYNSDCNHNECVWERVSTSSPIIAQNRLRNKIMKKRQIAHCTAIRFAIACVCTLQQYRSVCMRMSAGSVSEQCNALRMEATNTGHHNSSDILFNFATSNLTDAWRWRGSLC